MLYNQDILFIHIGKTGGTSVTNFLCKTLKKPVYKVTQQVLARHRVEDEIILIGRKHATLNEAVVFLKKKGLKLEDFKRIYAVIRNPYLLEVSLYNYYKKLILDRPKYFDTAPKRKEIILNGSFDDFVHARFYHRNNLRIRDYLVHKGSLPSNLKIIKFENLNSEFQKVGAEFGNTKIEFPHLNKSKNINIEELLTPETEEIIYKKYRWLFDKKYYERIILK